MRGSFALMVAYNHFCGFFQIFGEYRVLTDCGGYIGVPGFFVLSAFLLTYHLQEELTKTKCYVNCYLLLLIKYGVKRFFRVYIPFAIVCFLVKAWPQWFTLTSDSHGSFLEMITFTNLGTNLFWTMPVEMEFYLYIPVIAVVAHLVIFNMHTKNVTKVFDAHVKVFQHTNRFFESTLFVILDSVVY